MKDGQVIVWDPSGAPEGAVRCTDAGADEAETVHHRAVKAFPVVFGDASFVCEACGAVFCEGEA